MGPLSVNRAMLAALLECLAAMRLGGVAAFEVEFADDGSEESHVGDALEEVE